MTDYYKILDLKRHASITEIKRAYRQKALQFHPDKNKNSDAHEVFIKINQAYEILSDAKRRQQYDYLYDLENLNKKFTSFNQEKEKVWKENINNAEKKGKDMGEKYAQDYNLFSKNVMQTALKYLLVEVGLGLLFGEIASFGFLLGIILSIMGVYILTKQDTANLIGGSILIIVGIITLWWNLKNIATETINKK